MAFTHDQAVDLAVAEIHRMADAGRGGDPTTPVPTCPGWDLGDLLQHIGEINRWAAAMVAEGSERRLPREEMTWDDPADRAGLAEWVAAGADIVEAAFRTADPALAMWAWGVPRTVAFWPRRMVHESGVHRADAEIALGRAPSFDPAIAADGVDELLDNLPSAARFSPTIAELKGNGEVLAFVADDEAWSIRLRPDGFDWERDGDAAGAADGVLTAPTTGDLLLTLYGRRPADPADASGDTALVDLWLTNCIL